MTAGQRGVDPTELYAACVACPHVAAAWLAETGQAFAIECVVGRKRASSGKFTLVTPVFLTLAQRAEVDKLVQRFAPATSYVAISHFCAGGWAEVYRRPMAAKD